jgi:N-acetylglucosaminyl-diphospho-decaprenol L-rhamnosyltransferase
MMNFARRLSIVIVNWNSVEVLRPCLASIFANAQDLHPEIIVVDNGSFDGSWEMVQNEFPTVRFVQTARNSGFAYANNLGFQHCSADTILFLNPDTEIKRFAIQTLIACLEENADVAIAGPKLLNCDGSVQTSCVRCFPTLLNELLDSEFLQARFPRSGLWGMRALFENASRFMQVEAVSGACLMIRRRVFEEVGMFSTSFFMYAEDMDLCFKAFQAGWKTCFVKDALVVHHGGQSTVSSSYRSFADVVMKQSRMVFFRLHKGKLYAVSFRLIMTLSALGRLGLVALPMLLVPANHSFRQTWQKWTSILRWSLGLESWVVELGSAKQASAH